MPGELTILLPCLNEAETLAVCVQKAMGFLVKLDELIDGEEGKQGKGDPVVKAIYLVGQAICERLEHVILEMRRRD